MLPPEIKPALQGYIPSIITSCALDGTPNITYVSQVWYVNEQHVALSFQFFNKTIRNIRENPHAAVRVMDPVTLCSWDLKIQYLRTETAGPLFDEMDISLELIASMTGMSGIFELKGADIYRVKSVQKRTAEWADGGAAQ